METIYILNILNNSIFLLFITRINKDENNKYLFTRNLFVKIYEKPMPNMVELLYCTSTNIQ